MCPSNLWPVKFFSQPIYQLVSEVFVKFNLQSINTKANKDKDK